MRLDPFLLYTNVRTNALGGLGSPRGLVNDLRTNALARGLGLGLEIGKEKFFLSNKKFISLKLKRVLIGILLPYEYL